MVEEKLVAFVYIVSIWEHIGCLQNVHICNCCTYIWMTKTEIQVLPVIVTFIWSLKCSWKYLSLAEKQKLSLGPSSWRQTIRWNEVQKYNKPFLTSFQWIPSHKARQEGKQLQTGTQAIQILSIKASISDGTSVQPPNAIQDQQYLRPNNHHQVKSINLQFDPCHHQTKRLEAIPSTASGSKWVWKTAPQNTDPRPLLHPR